MFLHENEKCPVCDKLFTADDDIVVCPSCATPHHRQCYNELGHCANIGKHKDDFVYKADKAEPEQVHEPEEAAPHNESEQNVKYCASCGKQIDKNAPFCYSCGQKQSNPDYGAEQMLGSVPDYNDNGERIDDVRVSDIVAVVKTNAQRFLRKFKSESRFSWNWGAFFFGPYYLIFRKMYKPGILVMALNLIFSLVINGLYIEQITAFTSFVGSSQFAEMAKNPTAEFMNEFTAVMNGAMPAAMLLSTFSIIMSVVVAMIADKLYKKKVMSIIEKYDSNAKAEAEAFSQMPSFFKEQINMGEQSRASALGRMGGTTLFSPVLAYVALEIIMQIINKISF